jgi:hypothetical protein
MASRGDIFGSASAANSDFDGEEKYASNTAELTGQKHSARRQSLSSHRASLEDSSPNAGNGARPLSQ